MAVYGENRYMKLTYLQEDKAINGDLLRTLAFKIPLLRIWGSEVRILSGAPNQNVLKIL
jgi:hypothetical protein